SPSFLVFSTALNMVDASGNTSKSFRNLIITGEVGFEPNNQPKSMVASACKCIHAGCTHELKV
ncbi:hypothetical protein KAU85_04185, partial [Candidatus Bathyarchaeota archaeon]|nr:hypothetical protein [Candidatus Bathyarchaeota archaeon]